MEQFDQKIIFYLVRHGEGDQNVAHILSSSDNGEQFGLTETGRAQAEAMARELGGETIDIIFASPIRRTRPS